MLEDARRRSTADDLRRCSLVILLTNPDHTSALNVRKQLIVRGSISESFELNISSLLLSVPRNSKSAPLWRHRRWLLCRQHPSISARTVRDGESAPSGACSEDEFERTVIPIPNLEKEFTLVGQAAQLYPRNYHAWTHRLYCFRCISRQRDLGVVDQPEYDDLIDKEYVFVTRWINSHISDTTSYNYLAWLFKLCVPLVSSRSHLPSSPLPHATSLVRSYPSHEACWMYLRHVYSLASTRGREAWDAENVDILTEDGSNDTPTEHLLDSGASSLTAAELTAHNAKLSYIYMKHFIRFAKHLKEPESLRPMAEA